MSAIDDLPPLREVIRQHALSARKSLGQNFLLDLNLTARIARAAGPLEDATIIEIGPGPGGLTRALLALGARRVIAVERDQRALPVLEDISRRYPGRLVRLTHRSAPEACDRRALEQVAAAAFGQRRKMLRQSLKSLAVDPVRLAAAAHVDPTRRAETVPVSGFVAMARELSDIRKAN